MRLLQRNLQTIYYALQTAKTERQTSGVYDGTYALTYGTPVAVKASVSPAKGAVAEEMFGIQTAYDKTVVINGDSPITETSRLWIGIATTSPYNYEVVKVAKSLNLTNLAVREVKRS